MTRLFVLRHAKAGPVLPGMRDFDRPLDSSGQRSAEALGIRLSEHNFAPETIFCSPALRTRQTMDGVLKSIKTAPNIEYDAELYSGDWLSYLKILQTVEASGTILIVGHNPSCEELVNNLMSSGDKEAMRKLFQGFKPATMAILEFDGPFSTIQPRSGLLRDIWTGE